MNITMEAIRDFTEDIDGFKVTNALYAFDNVTEWKTPARHVIRVTVHDDAAVIVLTDQYGVILAESGANHGTIQAVALMAAAQVRAMIVIDEIESEEMAS